MIPEGITRDLRNGMGLEECLIKHNTNLKTLLHRSYPEQVNSDSEHKHIEQRGENYYIKKKIKNRTYYYGIYTSLEDAQLVRDQLILTNWKQNKVASICESLGVERIPSRNEARYYDS